MKRNEFLRKTKANVGLIELFYDLRESVIDKDDALCPKILQSTNHNQYKKEECLILDYPNGWTTISYNGLNVTVPTKHVNYSETEIPLAECQTPRKKIADNVKVKQPKKGRIEK